MIQVIRAGGLCDSQCQEQHRNTGRGHNVSQIRTCGATSWIPSSQSYGRSMSGLYLACNWTTSWFWLVHVGQLIRTHLLSAFKDKDCLYCFMMVVLSEHTFCLYGDILKKKKDNYSCDINEHSFGQSLTVLKILLKINMYKRWVIQVRVMFLNNGKLYFEVI